MLYVLNNINNYILLILINTMGRGAHAAHAAYNGSGTQGISVTNEINENEEIHSVFITENDTTKQFLHGHNISEMTCAGKTEGITSDRYKIFTPDEDSDMLGDVYLNFEMDSEISDFEFVDMAQSTEYKLQDLPVDSLKTFFIAGGSEIKSMELDLTTREVPQVETTGLNMPTVNKIKTFKTSSPYYALQVAVGTGYLNLAWRYFGKPYLVGPFPSQFLPWNYMRIPQFSEINDIIYDPLFKGESDTDGSIIFGGYLREVLQGTRSGIYFIRISDLILFERGLIPVPADWRLDIVQELVIPESDALENELTNYTHYITVNTLTYLPGSGFIASGRKYLEENELSVIVPEYPSGDVDFSNANAQTSKIFRNDTQNYSKYITDDLVFELIHDSIESRQKLTSDPDVTSILNVDVNGISKTVLSCGSRYNTLLGLDKDGLIIKSYDNGKTWEYSNFYYGSEFSRRNSEAGGQVHSISITNPGDGYMVNEVVIFEQDGATGGKGIVTGTNPQELNVSYGGLLTVSVTDGGFGYSPDVVTIKRAFGDQNGNAIGTVVIKGHIDSITTFKNSGSGYEYDDLVTFRQNGETGGKGYITGVDGAGGIVSLVSIGGGSYVRGEDVDIIRERDNAGDAIGVVDEVAFKRISAAYDYEKKKGKTFDKGLYYDSTQDPDFAYFMPVVSQLHTNNTGVWTAIGQQGIQHESRVGKNRYRQFVFRSIDDGVTWHPIRVHAFPNKREIQHVQFNSVHVEYNSIYTTDREACKILMTIPPSTDMASIFKRTQWEAYWLITAEQDLNQSNDDAVRGKSHVLLNIPNTLSLPWLGNVATDEGGNVLASLRSTSHRLTPWFANANNRNSSSNSGLYDLDYLEQLYIEGPHYYVSDVLYEYLGAISDGKRDVLFGKITTVDYDEQSTMIVIDTGIVTILATRGRPSEQDTQSPDEHLRYPVKTLSVKLGERRVIQNIVTTFSVMTAILKDYSNSDYEYEIIYSYDGLKWETLQNINNSSEVPIIQTDTKSDIIYSYKDNNESHYKIFKITQVGKYSEINVLNKVFTNINGINYAGTEWLITGTDSDDNNVIVKSYDMVKWRKLNINNYPVISSIVTKEKRLYETLVELPDNDEVTYPYKTGNFKTYEVCHSDWRTNAQGLGVRAYNIQDLNFSSGYNHSLHPSKSIKINSHDGIITNYSTTSANDILELKDGTIILCGENKPVENIGNYTGVHDRDQNINYVNLAEGPGADGLTFTEPITIYKSGPSEEREKPWVPQNFSDYLGITTFADSFYSLHNVQFLENNCLAIGQYNYEYISGEFESNSTGGLLALRHIPNPEDFTDVTPGGYYWKFIFGTDDPKIINKITNSWPITPFDKIHDVYTNNSREIVVVGKPKNNNSPIYYEKPDNITFKTFRNEWTQIPIHYHGFSEVLSVCYTGSRWVFVGIPKPKWVSVGGQEISEETLETAASFGYTPLQLFVDENGGKILAHTTDLSDPDKWKIVDFSENDELPFNIEKQTNYGTGKTTYNKKKLKKVNSWRGNHVRPVNYKGKSGVIINVSFYDQELTPSNEDAPHPAPYNILQEKVYFMYDDDGEISIKQNFSYPEPRLMYREIINDSSSIFKTNEHGGEQFRPTWETYINNELRTVFTTVYPSEFNQFLVDLNEEDEFVLKVYNNPLTEDSFADMGNNPQRRYRKFITTNTSSLSNRIEGNCYKIEQVKNENFISGVDSVRYLAVGKGIASPIVQSDDLINWTDVDVKDIFTIVFDISHKSGLWVAIGEGNYNLAISKDGKNWKGMYTKYRSDTLSSDYSTAFNSLDYNNVTDNNVIDVIPYIPNLKGIFLRNLSLLRLFSRVEYHVGTQIWQTLTFDDIKAMLDTEFGAGEYKNLLKNCSIINENGTTRFTTWIPGFTKTLNSKLETFSNISESGSFPSGLLKDQKLSIKIYYNKLENVIGDTLESSDMNNAVFDNFMNNTLIPCDRNPNYFIDSFLADNYGFQLGDTYKNVNGKFRLKYKTEIQKFRLFSKRFELDDIEIDQFNRGVKQTSKITQGLYFDADNVGYLLLDLDSFNLYASHIIVSGWLTSGVHITDMNLELNGYSYQKVIEPSVIDYATKSYLGLNYNRYTFNGVDKEDGTGSLVIPLASTAYSGSSIPLDRYNSIRLRINFNTLAGPRSYINVTCVGTTTVSYNNSTANIDLY